MAVDLLDTPAALSVSRVTTSALLPASGDLPVYIALPHIVESLQRRGAAVLVAPAGSGKTTLVPLALADSLDGRILVAEPRRVAARAAARRMAELAGDTVGGLIGYTVRGERKVSLRTKIEVVTTGVLVQRLQSDPELPGVAAVMIDECHERHLETDLALSFCVDVRAHLRDDLLLLVASATAQSKKLSQVLGADASVLDVPGTPHPIDIVWRPAPRGVAVAHGLHVDRAFLSHVTNTIRSALQERAGDVLVFLPGKAQITSVANGLSDLDNVDVLLLHGSQSASLQDAALRSGNRRRVVLASAIAESSLTVPGVRIVVDAGLAREPRVDQSRGLSSLVTVAVSRDSAYQRAGRAAREGRGTVYRCWSESDHHRLYPHALPAISTSDLTGFVLQLAQWGSSDGADLSMLDDVPKSAWQVAFQTLKWLGALDDRAKITVRGRQMSAVGAHPRLARAVIDGAKIVGPRLACEVVALLSIDAAPSNHDIVAQLRELRRDDSPQSGAWRKEVSRLRSASPSVVDPAASLSQDHAAATVVGLAYPERLARRRLESPGEFLMAGGTAASFGSGTQLADANWLAIADAARQPGKPMARIRSAAVADEDIACGAAAPLMNTVRSIDWSDGDVRATESTYLGSIMLQRSNIDDPPQSQITRALLDGIHTVGLSLLNFNDTAEQLRQRLSFCQHIFGEPWPDVRRSILVERASEWLVPQINSCRNKADLAKINIVEALRGMVGWQQARQLDEFAPARLTVASGSSIKVDYSDPQAPSLAVKLQECFGMTATPLLADGRVGVLMQLLSPAHKPVALTKDLESFWRNGYHQVRAEMRGRYPKHPWPQDPSAAQPTARTKPRR